MAAMNKKTKRANGTNKKKKYDKIYYNDGSGDNIPAIVGAMRKLDMNQAPLFSIKSL